MAVGATSPLDVWAISLACVNDHTQPIARIASTAPAATLRRCSARADRPPRSQNRRRSGTMGTGRKPPSPVDPSSGAVELPPSLGTFRFVVDSLIARYRMHSLLDFVRRLRDVQGLVAWGGYL